MSAGRKSHLPLKMLDIGVQHKVQLWPLFFDKHWSLAGETDHLIDTGCRQHARSLRRRLRALEGIQLNRAAPCPDHVIQQGPQHGLQGHPVPVKARTSPVLRL